RLANVVEKRVLIGVVLTPVPVDRKTFATNVPEETSKGERHIIALYQIRGVYPGTPRIAGIK
ncbi:MAG: hypothetical protein P8X79_18030, partial [Reinekea sp.]